MWVFLSTRLKQEIGAHKQPRTMAFSNFMLTLVGVGAAVLLLRGDVKQTANTLKKNVRQIRMWLEQEEAAAKRYRHRR